MSVLSICTQINVFIKYYKFIHLFIKSYCKKKIETFFDIHVHTCICNTIFFYHKNIKYYYLNYCSRAGRCVDDLCNEKADKRYRRVQLPRKLTARF